MDYLKLKISSNNFLKFDFNFIYLLIPIIFIIHNEKLFNFSIVGLFSFLILCFFLISNLKKYDDQAITFLLIFTLFNYCLYIYWQNYSFLIIICFFYYLMLSFNSLIPKEILKYIFLILFVYLNLVLIIALYRYFFGLPGSENIYGIINGYRGYLGYSYEPSTRNTDSLYFAFILYLSFLLPNFISISKITLYVIQFFYLIIIILTLSRSCILSCFLSFIILNSFTFCKRMNVKYLFLSFLLILMVLILYGNLSNSSNFERLEMLRLAFLTFAPFNFSEASKSIFFFKFIDYVWNDSLFLDLFYLYGLSSILIFFLISNYFLLMLAKKNIIYFFPIFICLFSLFNSSYLSLNFYFFLGTSFLFINNLKFNVNSSC